MNKPKAVDTTTMLLGLEILENPKRELAPMREYLLDDPDFQIVKDNAMLRDHLTAFVKLDVAVIRIQKKLVRFSWLERKFTQRVNSNLLKTRLFELKSERDEAFREYEMLRRLICFDNKLLALLPSEDSDA